MMADLRPLVERWIREWWANEGQKTTQALVRGGRLSGASLVGTLPTSVQQAIDHGNLAGLADDDHTQYVLKSLLTAKGSLLAATAASTPTDLPVGTDGQVLTADSTLAAGVRWAPSASGFADPTTTKGDLIVHGASTTRLGVGSDGQVLTADSAQSLGVKWATPAVSGGAMTLISDQTLGAAASAISFTSIAGSYKSLLLHVAGRSDQASVQALCLKFNSDTGANYYFRILTQNGGLSQASAGGATSPTSLRLGFLTANGAVANVFSMATIWIPFYADTTHQKTWEFQTHRRDNDGTEFYETGSGAWRNAAAITQIDVLPAAGNLVANSRATLWGLS